MPDPVDSRGSTNSNVIVVLAAIAAVVIAVVLVKQGIDDGDACTMSTLAVVAVASAADHGKPVKAALESAAFLPACKAVVTAVVEEPHKQVEVEVEGPEGETAKFSGSGEELIAPYLQPAPPPSPTLDLTRIIACDRSYDLEILTSMCNEELIEPTV
jgi:hypothetical protein